MNVSTESLSSSSSAPNESTESEIHFEEESENEQPEIIYSDPLDALEKATDTRIYNCPEFGEVEEVIYEEAGQKLVDKVGQIQSPKRRKRATISESGNYGHFFVYLKTFLHGTPVIPPTVLP